VLAAMEQPVWHNADLIRKSETGFLEKIGNFTGTEAL
jgi:hypothetical protein